MTRGQKIIVVMPAYNAAKTLRETYEAIPKDEVDEIILVDDASHDATLRQAKKLELLAIRHRHNLGYGGNQKTCYTEALRRGADIVIMLHPDGQYDPRLIPEIVQPITDGRADVVLGSRMLDKRAALAGGMPLYKFASNIFLTAVENAILRRELAEYHSGYRAFSRRFLEGVPFLRNSNDFIFDQEILAQAVAFGFRIAEIPITTRYFKEASSISLQASLLYGFQTLWLMMRFALHRCRMARSRLFLP